MTEARDYIWIIPLIAGILAIVSLLAPAAYFNFRFYAYSIMDNLWLWGLYAAPPYGSPVEFVPSPLVMIPSIVTTALIAVSGILLIVFAAKGKSGSDLLPVRNVSIITGILILASEILWLILVPLFFPIEVYWGGLPPSYEITFWSISYYGIHIMTIHNVGFGIIGGFIAAALSFIGMGAAHYFSKQRPEKISKSIEPILPSEKVEPTGKTDFIFCPECGAKIEDPNLKFCGNCGYEF
ncbi:MAG: zinc ribbon domain-containing protein [Promethearchaeota archaeon]